MIIDFELRAIIFYILALAFIISGSILSIFNVNNLLVNLNISIGLIFSFSMVITLVQMVDYYKTLDY